MKHIYTGMPVEFLPRTLMFYMLSHAYLFWRFFRLSGKKRVFWLTLPFFAVMGLFPFVYHHLPAGGLQAFFGHAGSVWLPFAFFCLVVFVLADVVTLAVAAFRRFFTGIKCPLLNRRRYLALLLVLGAGLYAYGVYEAHDVRVTAVTLATDKVPEGSPAIRIVFAADMHIGPQTGTEMLAETVSRILAQNPDVILLGGDLLDDSFQGTPADIAELQRLEAPLGVYWVLGNHDTFGNFNHAVRTIGTAGITLLSDTSALAGPLRITGVDDPLVALQKGVQSADAALLLAEQPHDRFTVLLAHRPTISPGTVGLFDLQLSGHSHGGQMIMFKRLLEAKFGTPTGLSFHQSDKGRSALFVTTGTGFSKLPIRLGVPPEIVVVDVVRGD